MFVVDSFQASCHTIPAGTAAIEEEHLYTELLDCADECFNKER